jgi:transposase-like protein
MKKSKQPSRYQRETRYFSEDFRRARVKEYDQGQTTVGEISQAYGVSRAAIYKWIHKYSAHYQRQVVKVVEEKSETRKRLALEEKLRELERLVGQQQVQIRYYQKLLEMARERYNVDFEKNFAGECLSGSSPTDPNTI